MCDGGVNLALACRRCGKPLLSCWDGGPAISWHATAADALACTLAASPAGEPRSRPVTERAMMVGTFSRRLL